MNPKYESGSVEAEWVVLSTVSTRAAIPLRDARAGVCYLAFYRPSNSFHVVCLDPEHSMGWVTHPWWVKNLFLWNTTPDEEAAWRLTGEVPKP